MVSGLRSKAIWRWGTSYLVQKLLLGAALRPKVLDCNCGSGKAGTGRLIVNGSSGARTEKSFLIPFSARPKFLELKPQFPLGPHRSGKGGTAFQDWSVFSVHAQGMGCGSAPPEGPGPVC